MINNLISAAFQNRFLTGSIFVAITALGIIALRETPIDAIPDLSENQVIVMTPWPGQSPKNIEDQITYPLTVSMQGLAGVRTVRAMSQIGVSMVTVIFEDGTDIYFARDRVAERLNLASTQLPPGVTPILGPDATGLGHIFMYTLESDTHSLTELRSIQDFTVSYGLQSVPGVAEVASIGGYVKAYEVLLDPQKLSQFGISIMDVMNATKGANDNVSGNVIDSGGHEIAIQGIGFFTGSEDISQTVLKKRSDGQAVTIRDVGSVRISARPRRGILADETGEKVGGIVVMRYGENPLEIIDAVKAEIKHIEQSLPEGVTIDPFYDRTELIHNAVFTLSSVLVQELLITAVILGLFLWHAGATIITALALLMGFLMTFIFMWLFGIPSNIMSLGGIAIAIGTMIDSAIVITENAYSKLLEHPPKDYIDRCNRILEATLEVGKPIVFAILIIILSFLPIFSLAGMEGKLFHPLAFTNVFAMIGALIAALFLVPLLATFFLKDNFKHDDDIPVVRFLQRHYKPLLTKALNNRRRVYATMGVLIVIGAGTVTFIGSEFMPPLDEGSILYMPIGLPDVSEERAQELLLATNAIIAKIPEVEEVVGKAGRALTATDPAPLTMLETFITLKPKKEWRRGMSKEDIINDMNRAIQIPNNWNSFTQPIVGRIDMISTGVRAQVGLKIFGNDSVRLEELAIEAEGILSGVLGAADTVAIRQMGLRYLDIDLREDLLAQYGISKIHALKAIAAGVGGMAVTHTIEGRERYAVQVRLKQSYRQDIDDVKSIPIYAQEDSPVLLRSVADIELIDGPAVIQSENGVLRSLVQTNVRGRDVGSFVSDAKKSLEQQMELPNGYSFKWAGQYENQIRAKQRLMWVVPLVVTIIFLLLFMTYKDFALVGIVMLMIPLSLVGGIVALFLARMNFSVAVWVGFIALFGNAVETGVVIIVYLENAYQEQKRDIHKAVIEGATRRLRPVLMTACTSIIGLVPMLTSSGTGAEVQRPLAIVVVFGLSTSIFLSLIVLPVLFAELRERQNTVS